MIFNFFRERLYPALSCLFCWVVLLIYLGSYSSTFANSYLVSREYQIKAAFLYNFLRFIEWPNYENPNKANILSICILGKNPFKAALLPLEKRKIGNRSLKVLEYSTHDSNISNCNILFFSLQERNDIINVLSLVKESPVLTVGDMENFNDLGGMVTFINDENSIKFLISTKVAKHAGLKISSKILELATIVD